MRMTGASWNKVLAAILLHIPASIVITGCAAEILSEGGIPVGESHLVKEDYKPEIPTYYDVRDVAVPVELKIERRKSFTFRTPEATIGFMSFSGDLESEFLSNFFNRKMPEDGWRFISSFKAGKRILLFLKGNRFCVITIIRKTFTSEVEILLTPSFQKER
jgi:hypothetical protein